MEQENRMAVMPIKRLIFQMALPPLCSMFLQYSYNLIDSAFVARLGEQALTAVSLSFPLTAFMNSASIWLGVGANVLVARHLGQRDQSGADSITSVGLLLSFGVGFLLNAVMLLIMKPYFSAFTEDAVTYQLCIQYMQVCAFMQIPNMVHIMIQKILQGTGNMLAPMWFQISGVVFNLIFDPLLIFGIGIFPELGISGAALSTVLGFTLSMVLALILLFATKQRVHFTLHPLHPGRIAGEILKIGFPSFVMNVLNSFMVAIVNLFLVLYSQTAVAFYGAYMRIQQLCIMTMNGLIQGCLPIMSFNYGANNDSRLKNAYRCGTAVAIALTAGCMLLILVMPKIILKLFSASGDMLFIGVPAMRIMALSYVFIGISSMTATYLQAVGKIRHSIFIHLCRQLLLIVPALWLFSKLGGLSGIWLAFPVVECITAVLSHVLKQKTRSIGKESS